eukprot:evm.model.scf_1300.1 EVM.evm.TU.scf_1300.1   scf_1300:25824-32190(+)
MASLVAESAAPRTEAAPLRGPRSASRAGRVEDSRRRSDTVRLVAAARSRSRSDNGREPGPLVVIDNYDSFTYNLCEYLGELGCEHVVFFNDEKTVEEIKEMDPRGLLISPGPGRPEDSGISMEVVKELAPEIPLLGVCMGLQCIGQVFGGKIVRAPGGVMHGKTSLIFHTAEGVLEGVPSPFQAARYHSLVIDKASCPEELDVTAWTEDGTIMGVRHKEVPTMEGVQFHPESIITDHGKEIVKNFVDSITDSGK